MQPAKKIKPGINTDIICKKCGHRVGRIRLKSKVKWQTVRWAIGLGFLFELLSNVVVYLIFN